MHPSQAVGAHRLVLTRTGNLLLSTFPFLALFQLFVAVAFQFEGTAQKILVVVGMYLFAGSSTALQVLPA